MRTAERRPHDLTGRGGLDRVADEPLICAECGREPGEDENAVDEWRAYLDTKGWESLQLPLQRSRVFFGYFEPVA